MAGMQSMGDFIDDVVKSAGGIAQPETLLDFVDAFSTAVHWDKEVWLWYIGGMHIAILLMTLLTRKYWYIQMFLLCLCAILVLSAEYVNAYCAVHWREFSTQMYFDPQGVFMAIVWSTPLVVNAFIIMVVGTCSAGTLLIDVKKHELKNKKGDTNANQVKNQAKKKKE